MAQPGKGDLAGGAMRREGRQLRLRRGPLCPGFVSSVMPTREDAAIETCKINPSPLQLTSAETKNLLAAHNGEAHTLSSDLSGLEAARDMTR